MRPHVLIRPEDAHPVQMRGVVVDELSAGVHSDLVDQFPTHPEGLGGGGHAHPVDGQSLEDPAGHPVGELGPVIGAVEAGLEDFPPTLLIGAGESRGVR